MENIYILALLTGLTGGIGHCLGMCGPIVTAFSMTLRGREFVSHLLYNTGRIFTYFFLGGIMGAGGSFVRFASSMETLQRWLLAGSGAVIMVIGLSMTGLIPWRRFLNGGNPAGRFVGRFSALLMEERSTGVYFPFGILMGFLPCGLVYTMMLSSMRLGMETSGYVEGFLKGGLVMILFGAGTLPAMLLYGRVVSLLGSKLKGRLYRISAVIVLVMGIIFVLRGYRG